MNQAFSNQTIAIKQNDVAQLFREFEENFLNPFKSRKKTGTLKDVLGINIMFSGLHSMRDELENGQLRVMTYNRSTTPKNCNWAKLVDSPNFSVVTNEFDMGKAITHIDQLTKLAIVSLLVTLSYKEDAEVIYKTRQYTFLSDYVMQDSDSSLKIGITLDFQINHTEWKRFFTEFKEAADTIKIWEEYEANEEKNRNKPSDEQPAQPKQPEQTEPKPSQENDNMNKEQMKAAKENAEDIKLNSEGVSTWKKVLIGTGAAVVLGGAGYLVYKNFIKD